MSNKQRFISKAALTLISVAAVIPNCCRMKHFLPLACECELDAFVDSPKSEGKKIRACQTSSVYQQSCSDLIFRCRMIDHVYLRVFIYRLCSQRQCFCGTTSDAYAKNGESPGSCESLCLGVPDETCGGRSAIEVHITYLFALTMMLNPRRFVFTNATR